MPPFTEETARQKVQAAEEERGQSFPIRERGALTMRSPANRSGGPADPAYVLDSSGPAAPPRDNGELVFAAPWESRAFGLALALTATGLIDREDFRQALIREIGDWEAAHPSGEGWSYYECWLRALERTATAKGLVDPRALADRAEQLAALPAGHDHEAHGPEGHARTSHNETPHHP